MNVAFCLSYICSRMKDKQCRHWKYKRYFRENENGKIVCKTSSSNEMLSGKIAK